jgi:hypothetical protein
MGFFLSVLFSWMEYFSTTMKINNANFYQLLVNEKYSMELVSAIRYKAMSYGINQINYRLIKIEIPTLKGQLFVEDMCERTLHTVRVNTEHDNEYLIDLVNQANVEASKMREYHERYEY